MICPKCGAQNMDGVTFCGSCGAQMQSYTPITPETPQQHANFNPQSQYQQLQQPPLYGSVPTGNVNYSTFTAMPPKNFMTESIIVTIFSFLCCCSPISVVLGIIAIVKANNVNSEFAKGNVIGANSNANSAKQLTIWAAVVAVAVFLFFLIAYFAFFASLISESGGFEEFFNSFN